MGRARDGQAGRSARGATRLLAVPLLALVIGVGLAACEPTRPVDKSAPVLFVHGYNTGSTDCSSTFDWMIARLRSQGFTGPMLKVGYYSGNTGCDVNLHDYAGFDDRDSWRTIAKAFAAYVRQTYTAKGKAVDAVGYSMGALVVRGAVWGTQKGEAGFGTPIDVQDVASLAGPHAGAAWYTYGCLWGQCASMRPGNGDLSWLAQNMNPQGSKGTDWTAFGSTDDAVVPANSATYIGIPDNRKVVYGDVPHTGGSNYMHRADVVDRAATALSTPNQ